MRRGTADALLAPAGWATSGLSRGRKQAGRGPQGPCPVQRATPLSAPYRLSTATARRTYKTVRRRSLTGAQLCDSIFMRKKPITDFCIFSGSLSLSHAAVNCIGAFSTIPTSVCSRSCGGGGSKCKSIGFPKLPKTMARPVDIQTARRKRLHAIRLDAVCVHIRKWATFFWLLSARRKRQSHSRMLEVAGEIMPDILFSLCIVC